MNFISKPSKENLKSYLPIGITLFSLSFADTIFTKYIGWYEYSKITWVGWLASRNYEKLFK